MKYLLDTHTWIWWNMNPQRLSERVIEIISDTTTYDEMLLSAISPWEFCKLIEKQRLGISCDPQDWINTALNMPKLRLVPLSPVISYRSTVLPKPFHNNDPADQIIVATAREEDATILTKDEIILSYEYVRSL